MHPKKRKTFIDIKLWFMQGFARKWKAAHVTSKVLPNCTNLQFLMVSGPRVPLHNTHKHIMGLLGILQVSHSPADRFRHERPWTWSPNTWLVCCGIFLKKPPRQPFLFYCQRFRWLLVDSLYCNPNRILEVRLVRCKEISYFFITLVYSPRSSLQHISYCKWQVWVKSIQLWGARTDSFKHAFFSHLWLWICHNCIHAHTCGPILRQVYSQLILRWFDVHSSLIVFKHGKNAICLS